MLVSNYDWFSAGSARFFSPLGLSCLSGLDLHQFVASSIIFFWPLGMPRSSDSNFQQSCEGGTPSENAKNALMDVKEEEAILTAARALNGEDVLTPKKRGWPSKRGKTSVPPKKKKCSANKAATKVVDLDGDSSSEGEGSTPTKWRDYEVETLIVIRGEIKEEFSRCAKKQG
jgi:hypothetical protein